MARRPTLEEAINAKRDALDPEMRAAIHHTLHILDRLKHHRHLRKRALADVAQAVETQVARPRG